MIAVIRHIEIQNDDEKKIADIITMPDHTFRIAAESGPIDADDLRAIADILERLDDTDAAYSTGE